MDESQGGIDVADGKSGLLAAGVAALTAGVAAVSQKPSQAAPRRARPQSAYSSSLGPVQTASELAAAAAAAADAMIVSGALRPNECELALEERRNEYLRNLHKLPEEKCRVLHARN